MNGQRGNFTLDLHRVKTRLQARLVALETRLITEQDVEVVWSEFVHALDVILRIEAQLAAQAPAAPLLTTKEMADRLGISVRALLQRKKRGHIRPSVAHGKALSWRPEDAFR